MAQLSASQVCGGCSGGWGGWALLSVRSRGVVGGGELCYALYACMPVLPCACAPVPCVAPSEPVCVCVCVYVR